MVGATLRMVDPNAAFTAVRASRGKVVRAEPVAALYQQGRVHHIGIFPQLEDQMTNLHRISTARRRGIRRTALMPWYGRSANCQSSR
jgi:phage terminase large subunit-like protein